MSEHKRKFRGKYQKRRSADNLGVDPAERMTISLPKSKTDAIRKIAHSRKISVSGLFAQSVLRDETSSSGTILSTLKFSLEDLEFMISILKAVGVPLALEELLSLLQKHKSKEVPNG